MTISTCTCNELLTIQKQLITQFFNIPLQYSLKSNVTVWRHAVRNPKKVLVLYLFEAAINLEPRGVLYNLGTNRDKVYSSSIFEGTAKFISLVQC